MTDWSDPWLRLKKLLATIEAACVAGEWDAAEEACADARLAATDCLLAVKSAGIKERTNG